MFFPPQAVFLGVWDMSKPTGLEELCRWLVRAKAASEMGPRSGSVRNMLVIVGTHLDKESARDRPRRAEVKQVQALELGWSLEAVLEVALVGPQFQASAIQAVREEIFKAASKLDCMGEFVDKSVLFWSEMNAKSVLGV